MAWELVEVSFNGKNYQGHKRDLSFTVRYESGIKIGDLFEVSGKSYTAISVDNQANRDEVLNIKAEEVKNDKPKARRNATGTRKSNLQSEGDDGHDNAD